MLYLLRRGVAALTGAALALTLSGCSIGMDVEVLLRPPHPSGEQQKIQQALEEYISTAHKDDTPGAPGGYVLKYPKSGDYRSAFILKDLNGDGSEEAIVFYRRGTESSNVHLNLLKKIDGQWQSASDVEGASADIERVKFGDMDGNGVFEVLTGWNIDNVRDRQLVLYSVSGGEFSEWYKELYSEFVVGDLTESERDSLLILRANAGDNVTTAKLFAAVDDKKSNQPVLSELGSTRLDGYIQQFSSAQIGKLTGTQVGVFVDGTRSSGGMVTELVYWDGVQLRAPFYNNEKNMTDLTYRNASLASMDVDGDGIVEWPYTKSPVGYDKSGEDKIWLTVWRSWNLNTKRFSDEFTCVVNLNDGYYLRLDDAWQGKVTVSYQKTTRTLALRMLENGAAGKEILLLRAAYVAGATTTATTSATSASEASSDTDEKQRSFQTLEDLTDVHYQVWFSTDKPFSLDMERIRYMFTHLK